MEEGWEEGEKSLLWISPFLSLSPPPPPFPPLSPPFSLCCPSHPFSHRISLLFSALPRTHQTLLLPQQGSPGLPAAASNPTISTLPPHR